MSIIGRHMNRTMNIPDDGDDNPKARRRGFGPFLSVPTPEDEPRWEARVVPMNPPPVAIHLPFEDEARENSCEADRCESPDCGPYDHPRGCNLDPERPFAAAWTDPDHEDERAEAEIIDIRAELRALQYDLYSNEIG